MDKKMLRGATLFLALCCTPFVLAHHSGVVSYELDNEIIHRDVMLSEWRFSNPHAELVFEAPDADGNLAEWAASTAPVNILTRLGYTANSFQPGQVVSIKGNPGRNGKPIMRLSEVVLADGTAIRLNQPVPDALVAAAPPQVRIEDKNHLTGLWAWVGAPLPPGERDKSVKGAVFVDAYGQAPEMPIGERGNYPLTEKGRAFQENWTAEYEECKPFSAWLGMTAPFYVEFGEPRAGRLHIRYEYLDQERVIWLDGRDHPPVEQFPRTLQGHSVGHWEGDTLVIETMHMLPNAITRNGIYHSGNAVLTEWISREDDTLTVVRVVEDPEHLSRPITEVVKRTFVPDGELVAYGPCRLLLTE